MRDIDNNYIIWLILREADWQCINLFVLILAKTHSSSRIMLIIVLVIRFMQNDTVTTSQPVTNPNVINRELKY